MREGREKRLRSRPKEQLARREACMQRRTTKIMRDDHCGKAGRVKASYPPEGKQSTLQKVGGVVSGLVKNTQEYNRIQRETTSMGCSSCDMGLIRWTASNIVS